jgi:hypothetical protein
MPYILRSSSGDTACNCSICQPFTGVEYASQPEAQAAATQLAQITGELEYRCQVVEILSRHPAYRTVPIRQRRSLLPQ